MITNVQRKGKGFSYLENGTPKITENQKAFKSFDIEISKAETTIKEEEINAIQIIDIITKNKDKAINDYIIANPKSTSNSKEVIAIRDKYNAEIRKVEITRDNNIFTINSNLDTYKADIVTKPDGALYLYIKNGGSIAAETPDAMEIKNREISDRNRFIFNTYSSEQQVLDNTSEFFNRNKIIANIQKSIATGTTTTNGLDTYIDLESSIINDVASIESGTLYSDIVSAVPTSISKYYGELLRINLRASWVETCKDEHERAVTAGQTPSYPTFPNI